jgi:hypothetical protein
LSARAATAGRVEPRGPWPDDDARRARLAADAGVSIAFVASLMTGALIMVALVVDLGIVRGSTRIEQSVADMAALAGGTGLASKDPLKACRDAIAYVNANAGDMPAISPTGFCLQSGNDVRTTVCSGGALGQAKPTTTSGRYTVSIHYPVPSSEIDDPRMAVPGLNDKAPCDRIRVIITAADPAFFGAILGHETYSTTRSATAVSVPGLVKRIPALWLLDPLGCTALEVSGGSQVEIGTNTVNGVVMVDSDASRCTGSQYTANVGGSGTRVRALDGLSTGYIGLYALPPGAITCTGRACDPANVINQQLVPQPLSLANRATRAPVDWRFNCRLSYPTFPALQSPTAVLTPNPCPDTDVRGPYIDLLRASLAGAATSAPAGFTALTDCSPSGTKTYAGNVWVNCPNYSIGNGTDVSFTGGNVIFTGNVKMTGGSVTINSQRNPTTGSYNDLSNPNSNLTGTCLTPGTGAPCPTQSSDNAAFAYFTSGGLDFTGGIWHASRTAVIMTPSGQVKVTGGSPPSWTAPSEGPFAGLSLWAEGKNGPFQINGGSGIQLSGAFFTPEGVMNISGGGDWAVPQNAQFISYQLKVSGGGVLRLSPDPNQGVSAPPMVARLIR